MMDRRTVKLGLSVCVAGLMLTVFVPQVLAFPYFRQVGDTSVYADRPIPPEIATVLTQSDRLLKASAIYGPTYGRRIFLTDGGWRWHVLSLQSLKAFGQTRALSEAIVVNRSDVTHDLVENGATIAGRRSLSGVIAHERTHGLIRARYGLSADQRYPAWLREGYCDFVAGGGSLSDADAASLRRQHRSVPALAYYDGRKRVETALRTESVDSLFAANARF